MENRSVPPYYLVQLGQLQENFHSEAAKFAHIMTHGGGLTNAHMSEILRNLNLIFLKVAAQLDAARDIGGEVTLSTGRQALALIRAMTDENETDGQD